MLEDRLRRLFAIAKGAPEEPRPAMPEPLKTRLLAHWRAGTLAGDTWPGLALMFQRGLICAGLAMAASVAWSYGELTRVPDNDLAIANYELRADVMP
jgi:hypothetical protein